MTRYLRPGTDTPAVVPADDAERVRLARVARGARRARQRRTRRLAQAEPEEQPIGEVSLAPLLRLNDRRQ